MGNIDENLILITSNRPENYTPRIEAVACYLAKGESFLFLKKAKGRNEEETWGVAGGKIKTGEKSEQAVVREVLEETGVSIDAEKLSFETLLYVDNPCYGKYTLYIHSYSCEEDQEITLSEEHTEFKWLPLSEAKKLTLLSGGLQSMSFFERNLAKKE